MYVAENNCRVDLIYYLKIPTLLYSNYSFKLHAALAVLKYDCCKEDLLKIILMLRCCIKTTRAV